MDNVEKDTIKPQIEIILQMKQEGKQINIKKPQEEADDIVDNRKL